MIKSRKINSIRTIFCWDNFSNNSVSKLSPIKVGKINVDQNSNLASKYGIMSIPTLVVVKNGEIANKFVGLTPKEKIEDIL